MSHRIRRARSLLRPRRVLVVTALAALTVLGLQITAATGGENRPSRPIAVNQTDGYGNDRLVAFTYFMNFQCTHEPFDDLDNNGRVAAVDPDEFQEPICQVGHEPTRDPTGDPVRNTEPLYVIVPFFQAGDNDTADGLGPALDGLFGQGFRPEAFDPTPDVPVQCPEPGPPLTRHTGDFGTCTMHPRNVDLGPVLHNLVPDKVPANTTVRVPLPNHSHIIDGTNFGPIWWQVKVVLVTDPAVWPNVDGTRGLNSVADLRRAQRNGQASQDVDTNFFLFFDSREFGHR